MKIYITDEVIYDRGEASKYNGGDPTVHKTMEEAIECVKATVEQWNEHLSEPLKLGENDGEKWADRRYDKDGTYAVIEDCDCFRKVEIFEREV